jgi:hypothetical protein
MQRRKMQEFKTALALALDLAVMCFGWLPLLPASSENRGKI